MQPAPSAIIGHYKEKLHKIGFHLRKDEAIDVLSSMHNQSIQYSVFRSVSNRNLEAQSLRVTFFSFFPNEKSRYDHYRHIPGKSHRLYKCKKGCCKNKMFYTSPLTNHPSPSDKISINYSILNKRKLQLAIAICGSIIFKKKAVKKAG